MKHGHGVNQAANRWHRNEDILANAQSALLRSINPVGRTNEGLCLQLIMIGQGHCKLLTGHSSDLKLVPSLGLDGEDVLGE